MENIALGEIRDVHLARMQLYADYRLQMNRRQQDYFFSVKKAKHGDKHMVGVEWKDLEDEENTWEPMSRVFADAPTVLRKKSREDRPEANMKRTLNTRYPELRM